ncbi:MAG: hypothetical protein GXY83_24405 [Rhodopirellula sp.]|nr:hypothetical protein [Rhodopirellula sp.]
MVDNDGGQIVRTRRFSYLALKKGPVPAALYDIGHVIEKHLGACRGFREIAVRRIHQCRPRLCFAGFRETQG